MIKKQASKIEKGDFVYLDFGAEQVVRGPITSVEKSKTIKANVLLNHPGGVYECPGKVELRVLEKVKVTLSERQDGNAMMILGGCRKAAKRAGWSDEAIELFSTHAKAGDYDHLLQTCMQCFDVD